MAFDPTPLINELKETNAKILQDHQELQNKINHLNTQIKRTQHVLIANTDWNDDSRRAMKHNDVWRVLWSTGTMHYFINEGKDIPFDENRTPDQMASMLSPLFN